MGPDFQTELNSNPQCLNHKRFFPQLDVLVENAIEKKTCLHLPQGSVKFVQGSKLTLKVLVTTIDALAHFETGQLQHSARGWGK